MSNGKIDVNEIIINTQIEGEIDAPWVTFSHSLATDHTMFDEQASALRERYNVLRFDTRGHGQTDAPTGPYSWDQLVRDVVGLWDALGIHQSHFVGLSMGGMIGIGVALDYSDRLLSLTACDCRSDAPGFFQDMWSQRQSGVQEKGMSAVVDMTLATWFTEARLAEGDKLIDDVRAMILNTPVSGYMGCTDALKTLDYKRRLGEINTPTQFIVGANDGPHPDEMKTMCNLVSNSKLHVIPNAAHLSNLEQPSAFNNLIEEFLSDK